MFELVFFIIKSYGRFKEKAKTFRVNKSSSYCGFELSGVYCNWFILYSLSDSFTAIQLIYNNINC